MAFRIDAVVGNKVRVKKAGGGYYYRALPGEGREKEKGVGRRPVQAKANLYQGLSRSQAALIDGSGEVIREMKAIGLKTPLKAVIGFAVLGAAHGVYKDIKEKLPTDFASIRQPPDGIPDALTLAKYDTFEPGDLIRKNIKSPTLGDAQHYAVYVGKDPITKEHMMIDSGENWKTRDHTPFINIRGLTWILPDARMNDSEYEKVPEEEMYQTQKSRYIPREERVKRAHQMLYSDFTYKGFSSNCESFARAIVEGDAYSSQAFKVSPLTRFVGDTVTHNILKIRTRPEWEKQIEKAKSGEKLNFGFYGFSDYARNKEKLTASQITDFLNKQDSINRKRDLWEEIPNPYTGEKQYVTNLVKRREQMERERQQQRKNKRAQQRQRINEFVTFKRRSREKIGRKDAADVLAGGSPRNPPRSPLAGKGMAQMPSEIVRRFYESQEFASLFSQLGLKHPEEADALAIAIAKQFDGTMSDEIRIFLIKDYLMHFFAAMTLDPKKIKKYADKPS
jgi:hypothetical protein